jgi:hypothetical protein
MASADLKQLDKDITAAIKKDSDVWRKEFSNIRPHAVTMNVADVELQAWEEMARREGYTSISQFKASDADTDALGKIIKKEVRPFLEEYHRDVTKIGEAKNEWIVEFDNSRNTPHDFVFIISSTKKAGKVFGKIKDIKRNPQRALLAAINKWASGKGGSRRGKDLIAREGEALTPAQKKFNRQAGSAVRAKSGKVAPGSKEIRTLDSFEDFGHVGASAVGTQRALATADFLKNYTGNDTGAATKILEQMQNAYSFILKDSKSYAGDMEKVLQVTLESSRMNKATMDKGEVTALQALIDAALGKVAEKKNGKTYWVMREGSDSFYDMVEKSTIAALAAGLKPNKTTKKLVTKVKHKIRKKSSKTVPGKKHKRKVTASRGSKYVLPVLGKVVANRRAKMGGMKAAAAPLALIGIINKELPSTVEGNMGPPRLESQTGRFAQSTRITDITMTPQGFPSIGYTYQRSPYETFETGGNQGSADYDPRGLIDRSIREIAARFAMGRFYTRRV